MVYKLNLPEEFVVGRLHRCSAKELLNLRLSSAVDAVVAAEELSFQLLFFRLPEATVRVEVAALTEFVMSV